MGRDRRFGAHLNPVVNAVIGGWSVDAIATMQKGNPFTITAPNNTPWSPAQVRANRYCFSVRTGSVHKSFPIAGPVNFVLRGEFFNTLNHAQFANPNGLVSSSTFGQVSATQNPAREMAREIQIAGTLSF